LALQQFQANGDTHDIFIMVADTQALTDYYENPEHVRLNVIEIVKDYLAVGLDPERVTIFIQSQVPELTELTTYLLNLVTVARLERNPTTKAEIQQKNYQEQLPAGFLCYPVSQAADITAFSLSADHPIVVPVGADQLPILEITNEIVRRFNRLYQPVLAHASGLLSESSRLMGIDGEAKASKSLNNCIFLKDNADVVKQKVFQMYTDPNHIHVQDPGVVEGHMVFHYLDAFSPDKAGVEKHKQAYRAGGLGDVTLKKELTEILNELLDPMRNRRLALRDADVLNIALEGSKKARRRVQDTMDKVRQVMCLTYG
jgi:tryptophanyl-tRNA synthetase